MNDEQEWSEPLSWSSWQLIGSQKPISFSQRQGLTWLANGLRSRCVTIKWSHHLLFLLFLSEVVERPGLLESHVPLGYTPYDPIFPSSSFFFRLLSPGIHLYTPSFLPLHFSFESGWWLLVVYWWFISGLLVVYWWLLVVYWWLLVVYATGLPSVWFRGSYIPSLWTIRQGSVSMC